MKDLQLMTIGDLISLMSFEIDFPLINNKLTLHKVHMTEITCTYTHAYSFCVRDKLQLLPSVQSTYTQTLSPLKVHLYIYIYMCSRGQYPSPHKHWTAMRGRKGKVDQGK